MQHYDKVFVARGLDVYLNKAKCVSCHGPNGVGGAASYTLLNDSGDYVAAVQWKAPALNTVLYRFSEAEVNNILEYGRPPSPMPAWGSLGGGPLSDQQLLDVIAYLRSIQLPANTATQALEHRDRHGVQARRGQRLHALRHHAGGPVEDAGRGAVQPGRVRRLRRRGVLVRPVPHQGLVRSACRRCPAAVARSGRT